MVGESIPHSHLPSTLSCHAKESRMTMETTAFVLNIENQVEGSMFTELALNRHMIALQPLPKKESAPELKSLKKLENV